MLKDGTKIRIDKNVVFSINSSSVIVGATSFLRLCNVEYPAV